MRALVFRPSLRWRDLQEFRVQRRGKDLGRELWHARVGCAARERHDTSPRRQTTEIFARPRGPLRERSLFLETSRRLPLAIQHNGSRACPGASAEVSTETMITVLCMSPSKQFGQGYDFCHVP